MVATAVHADRHEPRSPGEDDETLRAPCAWRRKPDAGVQYRRSPPQIVQYVRGFRQSRGGCKARRQLVSALIPDKLQPSMTLSWVELAGDPHSALRAVSNLATANPHPSDNQSAPRNSEAMPRFHSAFRICFVSFVFSSVRIRCRS